MIRGLKVGLSVCLLTLGTNAMAQSYSAWSDPNARPADNPQLEKFIERLDKLVTDAEKSRAADPNFLRDLRTLMKNRPVAPTPAATNRLIFQDNFSDGDFTRNPVWTLASGKYWIEEGYGLRTFVEAAGAATTSQQSEQPQEKLSNEELVIGILGAVLGGQTQQRSQPSTQQAPAAAKPEPSELYIAQQVPNAFSLSLDFSSWIKGGQLEFGPYQGSARKVGYRLLYRSGQSPSLQLIRDYSNSSTVLASVNGVALEDQKNHKLDWMRDQNGRMTVSLNGQSLINVTDQGFRDDFNGFVMRNLSGDYIFKTISMAGR